MNMNSPHYPLRLLPIQDLKKIGLSSQHEILLSVENIQALLAGRRTDILCIPSIDLENISINKLHAKLSLYQDQRGSIRLLIHPIYKTPQIHPLLSPSEAQSLISGQQHTLKKMHAYSQQEIKEIHFEYDPETKEFISYDASKLPDIIQVNGMALSAQQQQDFKAGLLITLADGTQIQHSASDSRGVLSSSKRLIVYYQMQGESVQLIFTDLKNLRGASAAQSDGLSPSYQQTLEKIIQQDSPSGKKLPSAAEYFKRLKEQHILKIKQILKASS